MPHAVISVTAPVQAFANRFTAASSIQIPPGARTRWGGYFTGADITPPSHTSTLLPFDNTSLATTCVDTSTSLQEGSGPFSSHDGDLSQSARSRLREALKTSGAIDHIGPHAYSAPYNKIAWPDKYFDEMPHSSRRPLSARSSRQLREQRAVAEMVERRLAEAAQQHARAEAEYTKMPLQVSPPSVEYQQAHDRIRSEVGMAQAAGSGPQLCQCRCHLVCEHNRGTTAGGQQRCEMQICTGPSCSIPKPAVTANNTVRIAWDQQGEVRDTAATTDHRDAGGASGKATGSNTEGADVMDVAVRYLRIQQMKQRYRELCEDMGKIDPRLGEWYERRLHLDGVDGPSAASVGCT